MSPTVSSQPTSTRSPNIELSCVHLPLANGEKQHYHQDKEQQVDPDEHAHSSRCRHNCRRGHSRRLALAALFSLFSLAMFLLISCASNTIVNVGVILEAMGLGGSPAAEFVKRQTDTSTGSDSSFVHNKLYLIVVFVGLFVVFIMAVCLSAWCCRGSFENPLCCPCYLCACCGGLACLDCIACGLCAEGIDQV